MCLPKPYCVDSELHDKATRLLTYETSAFERFEALHNHYQSQKYEQVCEPKQPLQDHIVDYSPEYDGSRKNGEYDFRNNNRVPPAFHGHRRCDLNNERAREKVTESIQRRHRGFVTKSRPNGSVICSKPTSCPEFALGKDTR